MEFERNLNVDNYKIRRSIGMIFAITSKASVGADLKDLVMEIEIDRWYALSFLTPHLVLRNDAHTEHPYKTMGSTVAAIRKRRRCASAAQVARRHF
jgi:hypothetical protein